ncbi:hypothetical protein DPMN_074696 [Dreissena polymorpha]|uniref:Uncharacterized protein n=1 Tax=Dreissena polymorpha TaxID=45954 RepID=A0A9D4BE96_DREPO|nr:hypothetical protein DPMN_074696 [Dreissena polymorpha]
MDIPAENGLSPYILNTSCLAYHLRVFRVLVEAHSQGNRPCLLQAGQGIYLG